MLLAAVLCAGASPPASTKKGLVVSAHPEASAAGAAILRAGGNALDAAIATAYALAVVEPFSAGIGGGGFLLYRDARTRKTWVVDYREVAPKKASRDMYLVGGKVDARLSTEGITSVAVPGMVPGLAEAQRKLGKKRLPDVVQPAIVLARDGFAVGERFREATIDRLELLRANPEAARTFLVNGEPPVVGHVLAQKDLARTLEKLAREGSRLFTHGDVAKAIAEESKRLGGALELSDLQGFSARWREPLKGTYRGHEVLTMPPPSSGGTHLLQILAMLELDAKERGRKETWPDAADAHVLVEAMRLAFADRATYLGDPAFTKVPLRALLSPEYLASRYHAIDRARAAPPDTVKAGGPFPESPETTHLTVIDKYGNACVLTQTVNYGFGSGVVVPGTGVLLNNEMDDFSAAPGVPNVYGLVGAEANAIAPGKIPLSSMTPTLVLKDGAVRLAVGSPGGPTIITTVLQVILHVLDHRMNVAQAIAAGRIHHQWKPEALRVEPGALDDKLIADLAARGHQIKVAEEAWGNATAIEVLLDGTRLGAADPRGDGGPGVE